MPVRLLIVDDSALVRKVLTDVLSKDPDIEIVGTAIDPYVARDKILQLNPDVMTLDVEMPRMDGITFLKLVMRHRPMPVIVMSSLTTNGSAMAMAALHAGAVDVVAKPSGSFSVTNDLADLADRIKAAGRARLQPIESTGETAIYTRVRATASGNAAPAVGTYGISKPHPPAEASPAPRATHVRPHIVRPPANRFASENRGYPARELIVMGASTGGTEALRSVLTQLPGDMPPIAIVQHIPAYFSKAFADRLDSLCEFEVREAQSGDKFRPGLCLVAPGGYHLMVKWTGSCYQAELTEGPQVHHQRPAVDVLFDSALKAGAGPHSLAVILTGMGADGAAGMLKLKQAGATTIAQNEETCVVFGMPREAIKLGAAQHILALPSIAAKMNQYAGQVALK